MPKEKVNEIQYAKLIHEKMQEHNMYEEGMGVELNPKLSERPQGLILIGGVDAAGVLAWAENKVLKNYELVVTP